MALGGISQDRPVSRYDRQIALSCSGDENPVDGIVVRRAREIGRSNEDPWSNSFHFDGGRVNELVKPALGSFVDGNLPLETSIPISHAVMTDTFSVPD